MFEWLQDGPPVSSSGPDALSYRLDDVFSKLWGAVRDPRVEIRKAATSALAACLQLITKRQTRPRAYGIYNTIARDVVSAAWLGNGSTIDEREKCRTVQSKAPKARQVGYAHGSLLVIGELLAHTGRFMVPRFREVCDTMFRYKDAKDRRVHRVVSTLLPQLADFCPGAFVQYYLDECIAHMTKRTLTYAAPAS
ncbi:hypothetical protein PsorP6_012846 [Peronosclerospora sorghi]|uniref:Uncharacterized protein n=1 Tax=Peronosclerospora sorghi TaxID=230839 RepID=A0ACC0WFF2_9STRA|nr:hypothetical protein PsorP6_012846 [Peronosclerospora sorghi]